MEILKNRFKIKADEVSNEIKELLKEHGNKKIGEVEDRMDYFASLDLPYNRYFVTQVEKYKNH